MTDSFCPHIIKAKEAIVKKQIAESKVVDVYEVLQLVSDEELEVQLLNASSDGEINIFSLPGKNIAVPCLSLFEKKKCKRETWL